MPTTERLQSHPGIRTTDPDKLLQWLAPVFAVTEVEMPERGRRFDCVLNHCELPSIGLSYGRYGTPLSVRVSQSDCFLQGFPLSGGGRVSWNHHDLTLTPHGSGVVGGPGSEGRLVYDGHFEHFILRVSPRVLSRLLSSLTGRPADPPLTLLGTSASDPVHGRNQLRIIEFLARELEQTEARLPPLVLAEIEQAILLSFLHAHEHNYSHWLRMAPRPAAPWQAKRAAEYIEAHWDQPVTIERLTEVTHTSARSLFQMFKQTYGVSPMVFVRQVRLRRARELLARPAPGTSVTSVSFLCGFSNLGRFSRDYLTAFGELPSQTLKTGVSLR